MGGDQVAMLKTASRLGKFFWFLRDHRRSVMAVSETEMSRCAASGDTCS
jgi:hypothetical protein